MHIAPRFAVILLLGACSLQAQEHRPSNELFADTLHRWIAPLEKTRHLAGTLLVARGDTVVFERSFGKADYELNVANTTSTRFGIASVTKPLTQIILLGLMDQGKIEDVPISRWIPDFPRSAQITVMHLTTHRSGIPHRVTNPADEFEPQTAESMTGLASRANVLFAPGSERTYSSAGYSVLARVLEVAGVKTYGDLLRQYVTVPAGAVHTTDAEPRSLNRGRARGYFFGTEPVPAPSRNLSFLVGGGSIVSTARDLYLIQRSLIGGRYGEAARQQLAGKSGLRWNGYTNGYRTFADYHAHDELSVIFTGNLFTGAADLLRSEIPKIARGEAVPEPVLPDVDVFPMGASDQARIRGSYRLGDSDQVLAFDSPALATLGDWTLVPTSRETFFSPQDYAEVRVVAGADGVEGLQWGKGPLFPRVTSVPTGERRGD